MVCCVNAYRIPLETFIRESKHERRSSWSIVFVIMLNTCYNILMWCWTIHFFFSFRESDLFQKQPHSRMASLDLRPMDGEFLFFCYSQKPKTGESKAALVM